MCIVSLERERASIGQWWCLSSYLSSPVYFWASTRRDSSVSTWSTPTRGATTLPLLSMAQWTQSKSLLDTCLAILSTSLHWTTRYRLRSKYFYYYSLFIVQCVQRTTRILPVCIQASSLHLYNRWWLSIQYICTAGDCRIPRDTSCESVFKCIWPCLLPRVVYQQSHTHNMIFTNAWQSLIVKCGFSWI